MARARTWPILVAALVLCEASFRPGSIGSQPVSDRPLVLSGSIGPHRYRISGRVRLLVVWAERDDVGGASLAWRFDGPHRSAALLAGSHPERAPRALNQWIYLREETGPDEAEVLAVRSGIDAASLPGPDDVKPDRRLTTTCAWIAPTRALTAAAVVSTPDVVTYRLFDRVLAAADAVPRWRHTHAALPPGTAPGFLTALGRLLADPVADPGRPERHHRVTYFYNGTVYDLSLLRSDPVGDDETLAFGRIATHLRRDEFRIVNRTTRAVTRFSVTSGVDARGEVLPVRIRYQPNWWLRIELQLDDRADVPPDPAASEPTLARMRRLCAAARAPSAEP